MPRTRWCPSRLLRILLIGTISVGLTLPSPAYALRESQEDSAVAELSAHLQQHAPRGGLEEKGEWSTRNARWLAKQFWLKAGRTLAQYVGDDEDMLDSFIRVIFVNFRSIYVSFLNEGIQNPDVLESCVRGATSRWGSPTKKPFWQAVAKAGKALGADEDSYQASIAAFHNASTLEQRWLIMAALIFEGEGFDAASANASLLVEPAKIRAFRDAIVELDSELYNLVQWDLRHRFPEGEGFVALHGSARRFFKPGQIRVHDGFHVTWELEVAHGGYAAEQLVVAGVPFERVRYVPWLEPLPLEPDIVISAGPLEVIASIPAERIREADFSGEPYGHGAPPTDQWIYHGDTFPAWAKKFVRGRGKASDTNTPRSTGGLEEEATRRSSTVGREMAMAAWQGVPSTAGLEASAPGAVMVFRNNFDLAALAVQQGMAVAVPVDGPEAVGLEELLARTAPKGPYAIGTSASARFLQNYPEATRIPITTRQQFFTLVGLEENHLLAPIR